MIPSKCKLPACPQAYPAVWKVLEPLVAMQRRMGDEPGGISAIKALGLPDYGLLLLQLSGRSSIS